MSERILFKPRNGKEVLQAAPPGTALYLYSDLASDPRPPIEVLMSMSRDNIILLQNPDNMKSGHWVSLSFRPELRSVYFFSSYGGMPDREKMFWLSESKRKRSGQYRNVLNDGLKVLAQNGWTIHYNDYPFQRIGDKTATCGIWATAFMNSGMDPEEFEEYHLPVEDYYRMYFGKE